ncbi:fatty-acid--CoA ligase FadD8 [soil metagenome]
MTERHPARCGIAAVVNALERDRARPVVEMAGERPWTGGDLLDAISRMVQALQSVGVAEGTRVALLAGNAVEVILLHNAIALAGGCFVAMHPMGSADDHLFSIEDGSVDVFIYEPKQFSVRAAEIAGRAERLKAILSLGPGEVGQDLLALAQSFAAGAIDASNRSQDAIVRLSYSGGTTGKPKAIPMPVRVQDEMIRIMLSDWEWPVEPRMLMVAPLSHAGGPLFASVLLRHGTMVVMPGFDPGATLKAIQDQRINCLLLVPTMIYALLDHPDFGQYDLSSLEVVYYGASLMSPARLKEAIEKIGPVFFQFYGQAEAPMTVTILRRAEHLVDDPLRLASCGRPVPWVDMALLANDNRPVAEGEPGEICVRGPLVMDGYLDRPDLSAETLAGGWLHTGDIAVRDAGGFLRIVDRKKDMIVTGGFNVFPSEVENVIARHPAVAQVAVFGVPDERWGEAVTAAIVLRPGASAAEAELVAMVREAKGAVQAPKRIAFLHAIPQTAVGKPDKKALRTQFG